LASAASLLRAQWHAGASPDALPGLVDSRKHALRRPRWRPGCDMPPSPFDADGQSARSMRRTCSPCRRRPAGALPAPLPLPGHQRRPRGALRHFALVGDSPTELCVTLRSSAAARQRHRRTSGALRCFTLGGGSPAAEPCVASRSVELARWRSPVPLRARRRQPDRAPPCIASSSSDVPRRSPLCVVPCSSGTERYVHRAALAWDDRCSPMAM
jgi:hypothetical protein